MVFGLRVPCSASTGRLHRTETLPPTTPVVGEKRWMTMAAPRPGTAQEPSSGAMGWIERLVTIDTTSRGTNLPITDLVAEQVRALGIEPVLTFNAEGTKANLVATFPTADGSSVGGVVLSAHTDVVPVDGQDWSSDPFTPEVREGRLYGRGTCDMKGFLGVVLSRLTSMAQQPLAEPIHLALSYDEEIGCVGAKDMVRDMVDRGLAPRACIVGEPTSMRVVRGHKSMNVVQVDFYGVASHSSLTPRGVNAVEHAAQFIRFVRSLADEHAQHGPFDPAYEVAFTTCSCNTVSGGIAINTVPARCGLSFEFRTIAEDDPDQVLERCRGELDRIQAQMREENADARVEMTIIAQAPGLETAPDADVVAMAVACGGDAADGKVTYGTEAGLFDRAGIPTVVCGPGDIAQAHSPDEFVALDQIARCEQLIDAVVARARR